MTGSFFVVQRGARSSVRFAKVVCPVMLIRRWLLGALCPLGFVVRDPPPHTHVVGMPAR